jgi:hypothetical protein
MVSIRLALGVAWAVLPYGAQAIETTLALLAAPEYHHANRQSPYYVGPPAQNVDFATSRQEAGIKLSEGGLRAEGTLRWSAAEGRDPETRAVANQFYYEGQGSRGVSWTIGRRVISWGVGFGFRPLDVVQREDRRNVNPQPLVGIPLAAMDYITADEAWTIAWLNPASGQKASDRKDEAVAMRWYRLSGGDDYHAVARLSRRRKLEIGMGVARVVGDEWSFHGAALHSRRYRKTLNRLAEDEGELFERLNPRVVAVGKRGNRAVLGAQWTGASGWSLLGEAFYDGDAYTRSEWRRLDELTRRQSAAAALVPPELLTANIAWSSEAYLAPTLLRENLLLRLSYDEGDDFKPYYEVLLTPADRGLVSTLGASYSRSRQRFSGGWRHMGGTGDSAYGRSPEKSIFWLEWRIALF